MALLGIAEQLTPYLLLLSVAIPPIAGVYLASFYTAWARGEKPTLRGWRIDSLVAWIAGIAAAGLETPFGYSISGVTAIDSLGVSVIVYLALLFLSTRRTQVSG